MTNDLSDITKQIEDESNMSMCRTHKWEEGQCNREREKDKVTQWDQETGLGRVRG